jgi:hypothetical protein
MVHWCVTWAAVLIVLTINVDAVVDDPMAHYDFNVRYSYDSGANSTGE